MFTVKLYCQSRLRIARADSLTVITEDKSGFLKGLTLHQHATGDDEVFYVGTISPETESYVDPFRVYDRAIIENANGKTTEIIYADDRVQAA